MQDLGWLPAGAGMPGMLNAASLPRTGARRPSSGGAHDMPLPSCAAPSAGLRDAGSTQEGQSPSWDMQAGMDMLARFKAQLTPIQSAAAES